MGLFGWLRERARRAVLEGIQDAANDIQTASVEPVEPVVLVLDHRPQEDEPAANGRGRKAVAAKS